MAEHLLIVLIVEDDAIVQPIVEDALNEAGFETAIAQSAEVDSPSLRRTSGGCGINGLRS